MKIKKIFLYGTLGTLSFNLSLYNIYNISINILYLQTDGQKAWTTSRKPVSQMDNDPSANNTLPPTPSREPSIGFSFMQVPRHGDFITEITKN